MKRRRYLRVALGLLAGLAAAWFLPVLFSTRQYHRRLEVRLEQLLGQPVLFTSASLELLPRPGFALSNATVLEASEFGFEPFARVDRIECDLAISDLLHGRIAFSHLRLESASINLARNSEGRWNFERLLSKVPGPSAGPSGRTTRLAATLDVTIQDARLNFKIGSDKKPFAITQVDGNLQFDRVRRSISLDLSGTPLRTDLGLPSPGKLELFGRWEANAGALDANLRTRAALLYDWVPLVSGHNPGIYGLIDADAHITGSLAEPDVEALVRVSQLRRWDSLPPVGDFPVSLAVKWRLERRDGRALIERLDAGFGDTHLDVSGTVAEIGRDPVVDLSAGLNGARLEDVLTLAGRLGGQTPGWRLTGRANGRLTVAGRWSHPLYEGLLSSRGAVLSVGGQRFPLSDASLRADGRRIEFASIRVAAGPHLAVLADGTLNLTESAAGRTAGKPSPTPTYELNLSTRAAPLGEILAFARTLGFRASQNLSLRGSVAADLALTGTGWPPARPSITAHAELERAQVWLPGLTRALDVPSAQIELNDGRVEVNPLRAVLGDVVFTGRLERAGTRSKGWQFDLHSPALDLRQVSSTFEALGNRPPLPWFENLPGLNTLAERRAAGSGLLNAVNAQGEFSTSVLAYGPVTLRDFRAHLEVSRRVIHVASARFRTLTGQGQGSADVDLTGPLPRLAADVAAKGLRLENWSFYLPPQLQSLRGSAGLTGHFSSEGTSRAELASYLQGRLHLHLTNIDFGRFDLLRGAAQAASWGDLAPGRTPLTLRSADLSLEVRNRRLELSPARVELGGAWFELAGSCGFDHKMDFESTADFSHVSRRWLGDRNLATSLVAHFRLFGTPDALGVALEDEAARSVKLEPGP